MELVLYPDPILKKRAPPLELMYRENGVGLAAPQVGWATRLFVMNAEGPEHRDLERVFINPRILAATGDDVDEEGCLSIPEVRGRVRRSTRVEVEAQDLDGNVFRSDFEGLAARVVQHEYDHLDGILFISRLSESDKLLVKKLLKRLEKEYRSKGAR